MYYLKFTFVSTLYTCCALATVLPIFPFSAVKFPYQFGRFLKKRYLAIQKVTPLDGWRTRTVDNDDGSCPIYRLMSKDISIIALETYTTFKITNIHKFYRNFVQTWWNILFDNINSVIIILLSSVDAIVEDCRKLVHSAIIN